MDFWETWTFGDLLAEPVRNGIYKKKEFHGRGQKIINMGDLFSYDFISNQEMKRIELNDRELANNLVQDGDLLFARRSFVLEGAGKCSLVVQPSEDTTFESSVIRVRLNPEKANPRFYYYLFRSPQGRALISAITTGAVVSGIRGSELVLLKVPKPPLHTQRKIAAILSPYDDLIENNTRRIQILEEMAQIIYRQWFVEFQFPGHENVPMVESELGMIPQGWKVKRFGEVSLNFDRHRKPLSGLARSSMQGKYPYYGAAKILDYINGYLFDGRYLLIGEDGSVITKDGKPVLQLVSGKLWVNNHTHVVQGKAPISTNFLYLFMSNVAILSYITGTAQPKINQQNLNRIPVLSPPQNLLERFNSIIEPIFDNIVVLDLKNTNLRQTRDLLLPKLISGELDVSELDINIDGIQPRARENSNPASVDSTVAH